MREEKEKGEKERKNEREKIRQESASLLPPNKVLVPRGLLRGEQKRVWSALNLSPSRRITAGMEALPGSRDDGPQIIRPIPRRPFDLRFTSPTPPEEDSAPVTPHKSINANDLRFLDTRQQLGSPQSHDDSNTLSRAASLLNLTSSTLFGIYAPTVSPNDRFGDDRDDTPTPWGTGAMTPAKGASGLDEDTLELMRERSGSFSQRRPSVGSSTHARSELLAHPEPSSPISLGLRAALLFVLGMGYGVLVTHLPTKQNLTAFRVDSMLERGLDWKYLTLWGVAGVALGGLLPLFDRVWEDTFRQQDEARAPAAVKAAAGAEKEASPETDWALVMRGIGAFVGIVFAIRKLPWASTLQVSIALALANPFLWYLIDRSKPGFLLSAALSVAGSVFLIGLNPDMMPAPAGLFSSGGHINGTGAHDHDVLGGLARQETVEAAIWVLSVLFCSCVCFGNIGRRLALNRSAAARGRWGGVR